MKAKIILILLTSLCCVNVYAVKEGKNGGADTVVCFRPGVKSYVERQLKENELLLKKLRKDGRDPFYFLAFFNNPLRTLKHSITSLEILDLYEKEPPYLTVDNAQEFISSRVKKLSEMKKINFKEVISEVKSFKSWRKLHLELPDLKDEGSRILIAPHCLKMQLAYQRNYGDLFEIWVNWHLFKLLSPRDKAALYFHELLYRWVNLYGQEKYTSYGIRHIVRYFLLTPLDVLNENDLLRKMKNWNLL